MAIDVPGVLSLIGGTPIKKAIDVYINKLKAAKTLDGGSGMDDSGFPTGLSGLLNGLVSGGSLSSLMQNPVASVSAILQTNLTNGSASITSALGAPSAGLTAAMTGGGGLAAAVTANSSLAATLSGAASGSPGPLDLVNHASLLEQFGGNVPAVVSFANASGPLTNGAVLEARNTQIATMTAGVIAGSMTIADATARVVAMSAQINGWVAASNLAFSTMQGALVSLAALNALGASLIGGSPELQAVLPMIVRPSALATLTASASAMGAETAAIDAQVTVNYDYFQSAAFLDNVQEGQDR